MRSALTAVAIVATLVLVGSARRPVDPSRSRTGQSPVISNFTPICAVPGFASYGFCGGPTTTFSGVGGKLNAVQPKLGTLQLRVPLLRPDPGGRVQALVDRGDAFGGTWVEVGRAVANAAGAVTFSMVTTSPAGLGFDLNTIARQHHHHNVVVVGPEAGRRTRTPRSRPPSEPTVPRSAELQPDERQRERDHRDREGSQGGLGRPRERVRVERRPRARRGSGRFRSRARPGAAPSAPGSRASAAPGS